MTDWHALIILNYLYSREYVDSIYRKGIGKLFPIINTTLLLFILIPALVGIGLVLNNYGSGLSDVQSWILIGGLIYIGLVVMYNTIVLYQTIEMLNFNYIVHSSYSYGQTVKDFRHIFDKFKVVLTKYGVTEDNYSKIDAVSYFSIVKELNNYFEKTRAAK